MASGPGHTAAPSFVDTVSARIPLLALFTAERHGVRRSEILAATGVTYEALMEEDARVDKAVERAIWNEAVARTKQPLLGLHASRIAAPGFLGLPELLFTSANTLRDSIEVVERYMPLVHGRVSVRLEARGDEAMTRYSLSDEAELDRSSIDYILGCMVAMGRGCTGRRPPVRRVALSHAAPRTSEERALLTRWYGTDSIEFGAAAPAIVLDAGALDWPLLTASPRLHRLLSSHADQLMPQLHGRSTFLLRARQHLLAELETGRASLLGLARRLSLGERSLQRRLAAEGSSYAELLEEVRRDLALSYLQDPAMGLSEIAFLLGYSSQQSLDRAFRAWTGRAPGRWRREQSASAPGRIRGRWENGA